MTFAEFFEAVHGYRPFRWQQRLAQQVEQDGWPDGLVLNLPTGVGKTAALDVAVFNLIATALNPTGESYHARRIFYVVDRRIIVDATFDRAEQIAAALANASGGVLKTAADALRRHFGLNNNARPLETVVLRGGIYRDDSWAKSANQPLVAVSTVDQVGSRLLFRGYGVSPGMRPVHAALTATDSLFLVDEAHLSQPFLETLAAVRDYSDPRWSESSTQIAAPLQFVQLSATAGDDEAQDDEGRRDSNRTPSLQLDDRDRSEPIIAERLIAAKPVELDPVVKVSRAEAEAGPDAAFEKLANAMCERAKSLVEALTGDADVAAPVVAVVVNRVRLARLAHQRVQQIVGDTADVILLTGCIRPHDRDELLYREPVVASDQSERHGWLNLMQAGRNVEPARPLYVVATQTIEVGADLDFDALITQAAPFDALQQRFGRLNRFGKRPHARGVVVTLKDDVSKQADDPLYGRATAETWAWLESIATDPGKKQPKQCDFSLAAIETTLAEAGSETKQQLIAAKPHAPVLMPAHVDLLCQTNPAPAVEPDVSLLLHGPNSQPADVQVVWRADLLPVDSNQFSRTELHQTNAIDTVSMLPPVAAEVCPVPIAAVRSWLNRQPVDDSSDVSDVEGVRLPEAKRNTAKSSRLALRWRGPDQSDLVEASELSPGDTIIVPTSWGGYDKFGWTGDVAAKHASPTTDVAESAYRFTRGQAVIRFDPQVEQSWSSTKNKSRGRDQTNLETNDVNPTQAPIQTFAQNQSRDREPTVDDLTALLRKLCGPKRDAECAAEDHGSTNGFVPHAVRLTAKDVSNVVDDSGTVSGFGQLLRLPSGHWMLVAHRSRRLPREQILRESRARYVADINPSDEDALLFVGRQQQSFDQHGADTNGSITLDQHTDGVVAALVDNLETSWLPESVRSDLVIAARYHDLGKLDERFQKFLFGDEVEWALAEQPLAKSNRTGRDRANDRRLRHRFGLPNAFRHEALSVQLLDTHEELLENATDRDLVRYLIGTHHGHGRPWFPVSEDAEPPKIHEQFGDQSINMTADERSRAVPLHHLAAEWPALFFRLVRRYGWWGLAVLETTLRLADQRRSAEEASEQLESNTVDKNQQVFA